MRKIKIYFVPIAFCDSRKTGSSLELNREYIGLLDVQNNSVEYSDTNGQDWIFYIGDTAQFVDWADKKDLENSDVMLYNVFCDLQKEYDYKGKCVRVDIRNFIKRNHIENDKISHHIV
ncbi:MAG: hypothetical protein Q4G63_12430 [Bacteroidia bacterium]|nr:hypothetical protein [Bacteroidia bacterium]